MEKTPNGHFVSVYRATWAGGYWNASYWKLIFSGSRGKNLPQNGVEQHRKVTSDCGQYSVVIKLRPMGEKLAKGRAKHRVFTRCAFCEKDVQAGRIAQHRC